MARDYSVGRQAPEVPETVLRDLYPDGFSYTIGDDPAWEENREWAYQHHYGGYSPPYQLDVGPEGIATWLPERHGDIPRVFFAARETVDSLPWLVHGELIPDKERGQLLVSRLTIEPWGHDREVSTQLLHNLKVAPIRDKAIARIRALANRPHYVGSEDDWWPDFPDETVVYASHSAVQQSARPRGRPRKYPDEHYRSVAIQYLELYEAGQRQRILSDIGRRHGDAHPNTVRDWVNRARVPNLGYLTKGMQGRAHAEPGPRLLTELAEFVEQSSDDPKQLAQLAASLGANETTVARWLNEAKLRKLL